MQPVDVSYYEKIAVDFAEWIAKNGYEFNPTDKCWWNGNPNVYKKVAKSTVDLLHIFKTQP